MNVSTLRKYYCEDNHAGVGIGAEPITEEAIDSQMFINFYVIPLTYICRRPEVNIDFELLNGQSEDFILDYLQTIPYCVEPEVLANELRKAYPLAIYTFLLHEICAEKSLVTGATVDSVKQVVNSILANCYMATVSFGREYKDVRIPINKQTNTPMGDYPEYYVIYPKELQVRPGGRELFNLAKTPYYKLNDSQTRLLRAAIKHEVLLEEDLKTVQLRVPVGKELQEQSFTALSKNKPPRDVVSLLNNIPKAFIEENNGDEYRALRALSRDANTSVISQQVVEYLDSIASYFGDEQSKDNDSVQLGAMPDFMIPPVTEPVKEDPVDTPINPPVQPTKLSCKDILAADLTLDEWSLVLEHAAQKVERTSDDARLLEYLTRYIEETQVDTDCTLKQVINGINTHTIPTQEPVKEKENCVDSLDKAGRFLIEKVRTRICSGLNTEAKLELAPILHAIQSCMMIDLKTNAGAVENVFSMYINKSSPDTATLLKEALAIAKGC